MLLQIFQRMTRSKQEICRDIFKVCRNIKFRSQHSKERRLCHDREVLCCDNHNVMLRGKSIAMKNFIVTKKVVKKYRKNVVTQKKNFAT